MAVFGSRMKIKEISAVQDLCYCLGQFGGFFICLSAILEDITGRDIDLLKLADTCILNNYVDYDVKRPRAYSNSMYILKAQKILQYYGLENLKIEKVKSLPENFKGKYIVRKTLEGKTCFCLPDYKLTNYNKVDKDGRITAYYLFCNF